MAGKEKSISKDEEDKEFPWNSLYIGLGIGITAVVVAFLIILFYVCHKRFQERHSSPGVNKKTKRKKRTRGRKGSASSTSSSSSEDEEKKKENLNTNKAPLAAFENGDVGYVTSGDEGNTLIQKHHQHPDPNAANV